MYAHPVYNIVSVLNADITSEIINDIIQKACDSEVMDAIIETDNNAVALTDDEIISKVCDQFDVKESYDDVVIEVDISENDDLESCLKEESVNFSKMIIDSGEIDKVQSSNNNNGTMTIDKNDDKTPVMPAKVTSNENNESSTSSTYYSDELLSLKGFSKQIYGRVSEIANLPLMCMASQFNSCSIQCLGYPSEMKENEFIPLFERYGTLYKLRIIGCKNMLFVTYTATEGAMKAVNALDRSVYRGHRISVTEYLSEGRLFVKPIPHSATKDEIFGQFRRFTNTLVKVSMFNDFHDENKNRGFCYLQYPDHKQARQAKKILESRVFFGGHHLTIDWPDRNLYWSDNHTLYLSNLCRDKRPNDLRNYFGVYGELTYVRMNYPYALVRFNKSEDAARAAREIDKKILGNENVDISMYRLGEKICKKTLPVASDQTRKQIVKRTPIPDSSATTSTLYVKNLHSDMSTPDLRKYFSIYGEVNEIDKDGKFASVRFRHSEDAKRAAREIDKHQLGQKVEISFKNPEEERIAKSLPKSDTLYITNLPATITTNNLRKIFSAHGNVMEIDKDGKFATVRFLNVESAERSYNQIDKKQLGKDVKISLNETIVATSDTLYITNVRSNIPLTELRNCFSVYGPIDWLDKDGTNVSVKFKDIESAERAHCGIDKKRLGDENVEVSFLMKSTPKEC